jgi:hypothetical protein
LRHVKPRSRAAEAQSLSGIISRPCIAF